MKKLKIAPNERVQYRDNIYTISHVLNLERVILRNDVTGDTKRATIAELEPTDLEAKVSSKVLPLDGYSQKQWDIAEHRFSVIEPLMAEGVIRTSDAVAETAENNNMAVSTVYRWLALYEGSGRLSSLIPSGRNDKGKSRIDDSVELLMSEVIEKHYLHSGRISIAKAYEKLLINAKRSGVSPPSRQTFVRRIRAIKKAESVKRRDDKQKSRTLYSGVAGHYEEAKFPLSVVQIDHTPVDLMFVDEGDRETIGRAWLTVAICVYSRVVCGYYLSYEAPSAMSVGQCLINAILPKEQWLQDRGIKASWPIWGIMSNLHADNGKDFRSRSLDLSCREYGININWRPLGRADFGGHIERLLGTFNKDVHQLEGTTFSNVQERGRYKSEQRAIFTLGEFDKWLCTYITGVYHQSLHSGIKMSPLSKLEEGYMGTDDVLGVGLPEKVLDENRLHMDFLPVIYRSVQRYGLEIDNIRYFSTAITKWIREKNPDKHAKDGKFVIKRDPRDVSKVYFLDPEINEYLEVPCINRGAPSMTLWELRNINKKLKEDGVASIDEDLIFQAREQLLVIEEQAKKKTKHMRRNTERKKEAQRKPKAKTKEPIEPIQESQNEVVDDVFGCDVDPFDDIRESE